jgi:hypothetical protein
MKKIVLAAAIATLPIATAVAQTPQQSPSQVAIQIDNIINQWAQALENDQRTIATLQKENSDLKAKYEPTPANK